MTAKEAWDRVKTKIGNYDVETANELKYAYVFSVRPSGTPAGVSTGTSVIVVDKCDGKIETVYIGSPKLKQGSYFKMIAPKNFV